MSRAWKDKMISNYTTQCFAVSLCKSLTPRVKKSIVALLRKTQFGKKAIRWYRNKERFLESEVFLISFPKCGRTWLTMMMGKVLELHFKIKDIDILGPRQLANSHPDVPKVMITHDDHPLKNPEDLVKSKVKYRNAKVIFLVRDPRDVVVSFYFQRNKRHMNYHGGLSSYLDEQCGSFDTILKYYNIWADNRSVPKDFLLIRYEDIHDNPCKELRKVLNFIGVSSVSDEIIDEAVMFASFKNMRAMEEAGMFKTTRLRPGDINDEDSYKTRKGKSGGFIEYLGQEEIERLNKKMRENLSDFYGYPITSHHTS